jgi:hypothetical protein
MGLVLHGDLGSKLVAIKRRHLKKSNHAKDWCGPGQVRSLGDFGGLDAPGSRFLNHKLVSQVTDTLANKKIL